MNKHVSLLAFLALVFLISGVSSYVTMPSVEGWYQTIQKPSWNPPNWVFAPVWTILYILIAISGWLVWTKLPATGFRSRFTHPSIRFYWLQLFLNFLWSIVFFGWAQAWLAAIDITALIIAIALTIRAFSRIDRKAAYLLVPYLLWVMYASTLNVAIAVLNPGSLL